MTWSDEFDDELAIGNARLAQYEAAIREMPEEIEAWTSDGWAILDGLAERGIDPGTAVLGFVGMANVMAAQRLMGQR